MTISHFLSSGTHLNQVNRFVLLTITLLAVSKLEQASKVLSELKYHYLFYYKAFVGGGRYYFEVVCDVGVLIKIGVARENCKIEEAFSDDENGWAFYNG